MRKLCIASIAAAACLMPQLASAQAAPAAQKQQSMQSRVKTNLEQAGFTDVKVMASSFLVQARDKEGNPVMMVINPDSVTSVTEISGTQRSTAAGESTTTGAATASNHFMLTPDQRHELWQGLSMQPKESAPVGFTAKVGEAVPSSIKLQSLPANLSSQVPAAKSYDYTMLQSQLLIVDPTSKNVVDIITQ